MSKDEVRPEPPAATLLRRPEAPHDATRLRAAPAGHPDAPTAGVAVHPADPRDASTQLRRAPTELGIAPGDAAEPLQGDVIHERYRLESLLGAGAMGQVWKAKDLLLEKARDPRPHVALKLLSRDFAQHEDALVAMQREAGKAQELAHPNIVTVFIFGVDPRSNQAYIAMELLEGKPLDVLLRESPQGLGRERALGIIRGLASGLAYAHDKGIVHCDFKPGNAFITSSGVAKVLDFGISRLAQGSAHADDTFDAGALAALTPQYATVEMLQGGEPHPADDVYALGLVAYQVCSGRHPFGGRIADEVSLQALKPAPIKGLKRREWQAIERALRLQRDSRWPDAQAFHKALQGVSPWVPALGGLAASLAIVAGYVGYQNYVESQPRVPFAELAPAIQEEFRKNMTDGDYAYEFATETLQGSEALAAMYRDAVPQYVEAYALHPKNPDADAALRRSLSFLDKHLPAADPLVRAEAAAVLRSHQTQHTSLAKYPPLEQLLENLDD
jgi:serine/threonine protein kinase